MTITMAIQVTIRLIFKPGFLVFLGILTGCKQLLENLFLNVNVNYF